MILLWFQVCLGLKINFNKSEMMGVNLDFSTCRELVAILGCKVFSFPTSYLGLTLVIGKPRKSCWDKVLEKKEKRLSVWKVKHLSIGGRIILIKLVLSSFAVYFLSLFWCPEASSRKWKVFKEDYYGTIPPRNVHRTWFSGIRLVRWWRREAWGLGRSVVSTLL